MKKITTEGKGTATLFALPWLVAAAEGYFAEEGIEVEFVAPRVGANAPQKLPKIVEDHRAVDPIRSHAPFEEGAIDVYAGCEWGQIRRAHDSQRGGRILGKRSCVAPMALFSAPGSRFTHPQTLRNQPISVSFHNGNHYATLLMLDGFLSRDDIRVVCQHHIDGYHSAMNQEVAAVALTEPWITVAEKQGLQRIIETHFIGSEIGAPSLDDETYATIKRCQQKAVRRINADKRRFVPLILEALPEPYASTVSPEDFHLPRLRYVDPEPYEPEEFRQADGWLVSWGLIEAGASYEQIVRMTGHC